MASKGGKVLNNAEYIINSDDANIITYSVKLFFNLIFTNKTCKYFLFLLQYT